MNTDISTFNYVWEGFTLEPVAWPAAALLPLPLGTSANESANSLQQYGGFLS